MKLGCIFTIIQLNRSIVHDIAHFISEGNNFTVWNLHVYIQTGSLQFTDTCITHFKTLSLIWRAWTNHRLIIKEDCKCFHSFSKQPYNFQKHYCLYSYMLMRAYSFNKNKIMQAYSFNKVRQREVSFWFLLFKI